MGNELVASAENERQPIAIYEINERGLLGVTWGAFFLAAIEAGCAALIAINGVSVALGLGAVGAAAAVNGVPFFHSDVVRVPILALATIAALGNLYVLWNGWRLRHAVAASWRYRPLTAVQRRRHRFVLATSCVTLLIVLAELIAHRQMHGAFFRF